MPLALWLKEVQGSQHFMGYSSTWHNRASVTTHTCWSLQGCDEVSGIHLLTAPSAPFKPSIHGHLSPEVLALDR